MAGYKDKNWLEREYVQNNRTQAEIAAQFGVTPGAVRYYTEKYGLTKAWKDEEMLRAKYVDEGLDVSDIAREFGVDDGTILYWMREYNIPRRQGGDHSLPYASLSMTGEGYEMWCDGEDRVYVHRLLVVAEYGLDALSDDVHHHSGIPWDNRPENVKPMSRSEHQKEHAKNRLAP